jgi:hypothetical protein
VLVNQLFKTFAVESITQGLSFIQDLKLGHYLKIPPRSTFIAQLTSTVLCGLVQTGTKTLLFATVKNMCGSHQQDLLTCASTKVFFTSSVIWYVPPSPHSLFWTKLKTDPKLTSGDLSVQQDYSPTDHSIIPKLTQHSSAQHYPSHYSSGCENTQDRYSGIYQYRSYSRVVYGFHRRRGLIIRVSSWWGLCFNL